MFILCEPFQTIASFLFLSFLPPSTTLPWTWTTIEHCTLDCIGYVDFSLGNASHGRRIITSLFVYYRFPCFSLSFSISLPIFLVIFLFLSFLPTTTTLPWTWMTTNANHESDGFLGYVDFALGNASHGRRFITSHFVSPCIHFLVCFLCIFLSPFNSLSLPIFLVIFLFQRHFL